MGYIHIISSLVTPLVAILWQWRTGGAHTAFRPLPWWCNITGLTLLVLGVVLYSGSDPLRLPMCTIGLLFILLSRDRKPSNNDLPLAISFACTLLITIGHMLITKTEVPLLAFASTVLLLHIFCRYVLKALNRRKQLTTNNINNALDKGNTPLASRETNNKADK